MKKILKELQQKVLQMITDNNYELVKADFELDNLKLVFILDEIEFRINLVPYKGGILLVEHTGHECLLDDSIASLLYSRHGDPIKKAEIQNQIARLQNMLK